MILKTEWRQLLLNQRKAISKERRDEASRLIIDKLESRGTLLSFSPMGSEIDLKPLNDRLAAKGRLFLVPYTFDALSQVPISQIDCILVPALGFDREHYRIGYGKGFYDRFLAIVGDKPTIGVGFREQMYEGLLPRDPWDMPVKELLLV